MSRWNPSKPSLGDVHPHLVPEWDNEKNDCSPYEIAPSSGRKPHWICPEGHSYTARIADRTYYGSGCPVCTGKSVLAGVNDLDTLFPTIGAQVHPNNPLKATELTAASNKRTRWLCPKCSYDWYTTPYDRTRTDGKANGCPHCGGRVPITGLDDLETLFPHIAAELDTDRNGGILPSQLLPLSNRYLYWLCENNHSVRTQVSSRVRHWGCRKCSSSRVEKDLAKGLAKSKVAAFLEHAHPLPVLWRSQKTAIVDIYLELASGLRVVIEYDGEWWHRDKQEVDRAKTEALLNAGYTVVRVREYQLEHLTMAHPALYQFNHGSFARGARKDPQTESLIVKMEALLASL